jgi:hypothetical protein
MQSFDSAPEFDGFSRVVILVSDEVEYSAGNNSGRTLTLTNPWGTQDMANRILSRIRGFQYQPYTANKAILDPAAELGDAVTANNTHGGIYTRRETFGPLMRSTVSAPEDEEIDHEYQYVSKQDRVIKRNMRELTAELKVQAGLISAEVTDRKSAIEQAYAALTIQADRITQEVTARENDVNSLSAALNTQADKIEAKVSKNGGRTSSFGWTLTDSDWTIQANGSNILRATKSGLEVTGKITATSGRIGGFDILSDYLSYNSQTWGGTNTYGAYLGVNGIQLGQNFRVDMAGNLVAYSGTFLGTVSAGKIAFGEEYGSLSGEALAAGSVTGGWYGAISEGTIDTYNTSWGINTSLGYANFANDVLTGIDSAERIIVGDLDAGSASVSELIVNGAYVAWKEMTIATPGGGSAKIKYLGRKNE